MLFSNKINHLKEIETCKGNINKTLQYKYLGIIFDENLKFKNHIEYITNKLNQVNTILYKLRYFIDYKTLKIVYYSLAYPHLIYGCLTWGLNYKTSLNSINIALNNIIRTINFVKISEKIELSKLYTQSQILNVFMIIGYYILLNSFSMDKNPIQHNYSTRRKTNGNFTHPQCNNNFGKRSLMFMGPYLLNLTPKSIKTNGKYLNYKKLCKQWITLNSELTLNTIYN